MGTTVAAAFGDVKKVLKDMVKVYTADPLTQAAKPDMLFSRTAMAKSGVSSPKK